jgi:hypothetical protein
VIDIAMCLGFYYKVVVYLGVLRTIHLFAVVSSFYFFEAFLKNPKKFFIVFLKLHQFRFSVHIMHDG